MKRRLVKEFLSLHLFTMSRAAKVGRAHTHTYTQSQTITHIHTLIHHTRTNIPVLSTNTQISYNTQKLGSLVLVNGQMDKVIFRDCFDSFIKKILQLTTKSLN